MIKLPTDVQQGLVGALTILLFILMALEITGPEVLFLIALMVVTLAQILTLTEALSGMRENFINEINFKINFRLTPGFANESMITIGTLFLVVGAVEKSHCVDWLARKTFGSEGPLLLGKARMYCMSFALSIFFNNTPLVAILLPVVKDWGRLRNIAASQLLMPLSFSVLGGSFVSMIGTSTNLTVQGLMQADRGYSFPFFAPGIFILI
jgi:Na+/H+ antiporter NhaD/arsenite permease-like protein